MRSSATKQRVLLATGFVLISAAAWLMRADRHATVVSAFRQHDVSGIDRMLASGLRLRSEVLQARAGLSLSFDEINAAVLTLRSAEASALTVRGRGSLYADAADSLASTADTLRHDEPILERFKSDLSLLQLSTRYFPRAADALGQRLVRSSETSIEKGVLANTLGALAFVTELRTGVGRYVEAPTKENTLVLQASLQHATALSGELSSALHPELPVLLGHSRSILARREGVDSMTQVLLQSPILQQLQVARAAYQAAAEQQVQRTTLWRLFALELFALGLGAILASVFMRLRAAQQARP